MVIKKLHTNYNFFLGHNNFPEDTEKGFKYIKMAADSGLPIAQWNLGKIYEIGFFKVEKNTEEAIRWYKRAAALGHELAREDLSKLLKN